MWLCYEIVHYKKLLEVLTNGVTKNEFIKVLFFQKYIFYSSCKY